MTDRAAQPADRTTAGALLGHAPDQRLVLITCDDLGLCPEADAATIAALRAGRATGAALLVPAGGAREAATEAEGLSLGVHLALNSEWERARWAPLTRASSLCDDDGSLCRSPRSTVAQADAAEARAELRAQIDQAMAWGIEPTHLDAHLYVVQEREDLFDAYLELARELRLPVRVSGSVLQPDHPFRRRAAAAGVPCPDHLVRLDGVGSRAPLMRALRDLPAGVSEFHLHPAVDSPALRALASDWAGRVDDAALLDDASFWSAVERSGAMLVGYRDLRDAARSAEGR